MGEGFLAWRATYEFLPEWGFFSDTGGEIRCGSTKKRLLFLCLEVSK
jgi:hypothetical protein